MEEYIFVGKNGWLLESLLKYYKAETKPSTFPTLFGNVVLEWTFGNTEVSCEVDVDKKIGLYHEVDCATGGEYCETLFLHNFDGWNKLNAHIKRLENKRLRELLIQNNVTENKMCIGS